MSHGEPLTSSLSPAKKKQKKIVEIHSSLCRFISILTLSASEISLCCMCHQMKGFNVLLFSVDFVLSHKRKRGKTWKKKERRKSEI